MATNTQVPIPFHRVPQTGAEPQPDPTPQLRVAPEPAPDVEVVVPVYNEQEVLAASVRRLDDYLSEGFPFSYRITIVDNASTDATWDVATALSRDLPNVAAKRLDQKGRGRALRQTWLASDAAVVSYMDVDLSTDLAAFLPLVAPLISGHSDLAIGSRLSRGSRVVRGPKRETISRCYNVILRTTLRAKFSDAQCGFKAMRADRARELLPLVEDSDWFFDTELLVLAERAGLRIHEVPVDWVDDPDSRVDIVATAMADLRGVKRMITQGLKGYPILEQDACSAHPNHPQGLAASDIPPGLPKQLVRFIGVGLVSTAAYALLFVLFRDIMSAQFANAVALVVTAILNTAANRRFTFGVRGRRRVVTHQAQGLVVFVLGLAVTSGSLALLQWLLPQAGLRIELTVLVVANLVATVLRFLLLRSWVFRAHLRVSTPVPPRPANLSRRPDLVASGARSAQQSPSTIVSLPNTVRNES
ncbi:MAG: bifunctional glycosyltransferase family 2/GtrA family protein [Actinomycetes bacterium]